MGAGAQIIDAQTKALVAQDPGQPTPVGSFDVTQLGDAQDKIGKDDNFRGLTMYNNVLYYTKGSGGNGIDTVYFLDTTGNACPSLRYAGVGLPQPGATLPTAPLATTRRRDDCRPAEQHVHPQGLPDALLCQEGDELPVRALVREPDDALRGRRRERHDTSRQERDLHAAASRPTPASRNGALVSGSLEARLHACRTGSTWARRTRRRRGRLPDRDQRRDRAPWTPATDGLRNLTGQVNRDGTVTIWAVTSTVSGSGDQGADPNKLVSITDDPSASVPRTGESFHTVLAPRYAQVVRGVAFVPTGYQDWHSWSSHEH